MNITPEISIFVSGLATLVVASVFAAITYMYIRLFNKYYQLKITKDVAKLKEEEVEQSYKKAQKVIDEANQKSQKIVEEASAKAQEIIKNAQFITQDEAGKIGTLLESVSKQHSADFQRMLANFSNNTTQLLNSISDNLGIESSQELEKFKVAVQEEIGKFNRSLMETVEVERRKVQAEVLMYKQSQIEKVNQKLVELVGVIVKEVLGKTLTAQDHEELILEALEKAKKEGMY